MKQSPEQIIAERGKVIDLGNARESIKQWALSSGAFVAGFIPPDYVLDGVLQRGFLYGFTAKTGAGKTAIALRFLAHVPLGKPFAGREVQKCKALMLVGENADDVRARWIALSEQMGFDPDTIEVHFIPSIFNIAAELERLKDLADELGGVGLVVADTSAAYFTGDDENSNTQLGDHARALRSLTELNGRPCVLVPCHPTKGASEDNLVPRGGGAFLAELDGNLTAAKKDGAVEVHWQGKFRGPDFEPMSFELLTVTSPQLRDSRGRHVPTVVARPLSASEQAARESAADGDVQLLLKVMAANPDASISSLAILAGWTLATGEPHKTKVARTLKELSSAGMAKKELKNWSLTPSGIKAAAKAAI